MNDRTLGGPFETWALHEPTISGLVMIGSRTRETKAPDAADDYSDWDFQVITSRPELFENSDWVKATALPIPLVYVFRGGRLGQAPKVTMVFASGEMDLVVISKRRLQRAKISVRFGLASIMPSVRAALASLAVVLKPGFRILKGADVWSRFFQRVAKDFQPAAPSNRDLCLVADGFVADYVSTWRKIQRGELLAAQRWLHHYLVEANFQLLMVLEQRAGRQALPDARRLERLVSSDQLAAVRVSAIPDADSLTQAVEGSAETLRRFMQALVGDEWTWPKLGLSLGAE